MQPPKLAREIMVKKLVTLQPSLHVCDGLVHLLKSKISGAPVIQPDRHYLGVFSEKCCMSVLSLAARLATQSGQLKSLLDLRAMNLMVTDLVTLHPQLDAVDAIGRLLKHRISGAPVIDQSGHYLGALTERYSMQMLVDAAYEQMPLSTAGGVMNTDMGRVISEDATLTQIVEIFLNTHFRRLVVLREGKLLGQISRRDVLNVGQRLAALLRSSDQSLIEHRDEILHSDDHEAVGQTPLASLEVAAFMDRQARTIREETDLLSIAQTFLNTNYRRLPVLESDKLVGQISRRDLLQAIYDLLSVAPKREVTLLYLSSLVDREDAPISQ